jgi:hypothetical protein
MSHFAKIDDNNIVTDVIVAEQDYVDGLEGTWIQTSYNTQFGKHYDPVTGLEDDGTPLRMNFATAGCRYHPEADAFEAINPHDGWILNTETYSYEAPVPMPELSQEELDAGGHYVWNDNDQQWAYIDDNSSVPSWITVE